jgi:hypothetical protein
LTSFFPIWIPFTCSFCLIVLARNSKSVMNYSGESGYTCLVPGFRWCGFSFSPFSMMLAVGLSQIAFIIWNYSWFHQSFYHERMLDFVKGFFLHLIEMIMLFFVFVSVNKLYYL